MPNAAHEVTAQSVEQNRFPWLAVVLCVIVIKSTVFFFDSKVRLFHGDSLGFLAGASGQWLTIERSYLYKYLLRWVALTFDSLYLQVLFQTFCGGVASVLMGYIAWGYLGSSRVIAAASAALLAMDPLHLVYERFIMAEAVTAPFMAVYMLLWLAYLKHRSLRLIAAANISGVLLFSLRINLLPVAILSAVLCPFLAWSRAQNAARSSIPGAQGRRRLLLELGVSVLSLVVSHAAYRQTAGYLGNRPPAYTHIEGCFTLCAVAPLISAADFPSAALADQVLPKVSRPLGPREERASHLWDKEGLCARLRQVVHGYANVNTVGSAMAVHAVMRNPLAAAKLWALTYLDYFDSERLSRRTLNAITVSASGKLKSHRALIVDRLGYEDKPESYAPSLTTNLLMHSLLLYQLCMLLPFFAAAMAVFDAPFRAEHTLIASIAFGIIVVISMFGLAPIVRYVEPVVVLAILLLARLAAKYRPIATLDASPNDRLHG